MTPRGIRLNNPGNIRISKQSWLGKDMPSKDSEFESFGSPFYGIRALARILYTYMVRDGLNTIRYIIAKYAPTSENDTVSYMDSVSAKTGYGLDEELEPDAETLCELVPAIIQHETGQQPYSDEEIEKAVYSALGIKL